MKPNNITRWLRPGIGIKRWMCLGSLGIIMFSIGFSNIADMLLINLETKMQVTTVFIIIGIILIVVSVKQAFKSIIDVICNKRSYNKNREKINQLLYKERILNKRPKIVVIGGGTGLSVLLRGLKEHTTNITAIVTVADDGGGSGVLREDLGMLPPGDIRSCILALANTEPAMESILQYRFKEGSLKGQSFGNLFIAAMNEIHGNFETAIKEISNVLAVTGKVLPMTLEDVTLFAKLENGEIVMGESNIPIKNKQLDSRIKKVFIKPKEPEPLDETVEAIREADCILLGPGSLYTSVIPNLLVKNIAKEIECSKAIKVYAANVMTQPGETDDHSVLDHIEAIHNCTRRKIIDYVVVNNETIPNETLNKYNQDGARQLVISPLEEEILGNQNIEVIKDKLIDIKKDYIRHDAEKLSEIIIKLTLEKLEENTNIEA